MDAEVYLLILGGFSITKEQVLNLQYINMN